jgi:hypothetical protein
MNLLGQLSTVHAYSMDKDAVKSTSIVSAKSLQLTAESISLLVITWPLSPGPYSQSNRQVSPQSKPARIQMPTTNLSRTFFPWYSESPMATNAAQSKLLGGNIRKEGADWCSSHLEF